MSLVWGSSAATEDFVKAAETIAVLLASQGQHNDAQEAYACTSVADRAKLVWLGNTAIRFAPEHNRTHVAQVVKLALDAPEAGGPGVAADFVVAPEHQSINNELWYRGYRVLKGDGRVDLGLLARTPAEVARRIVGLYTVRSMKVLA